MKYKNLIILALLIKNKIIISAFNNKININANNKINSKKNIAKSVILTTLTTKQAIDIANKVFIPIPESRRLINSILFASITSLLINTHEDFKNIYTPVEPKPPLPRIVSPSSSTESTSIT